MFIIFIFFLSSLYSGALFKFLQSNDYEKAASTMEEMAEWDYKFYVLPSYNDMTSDSIPMKGR